MASETNQSNSQAGVDPAARVLHAEAIVHRNVLWALGAGAVPVPVVDVLVVTGVQVKLLKELSEHYKVPFKEGLVKKLVGSLFVSLGGIGFGVMLGGSLAKLIPGVGTALGIVTIPVMVGAFTHAVGRVFVMHFESGGTFLDFDPQRMRDHFRAEFDQAKTKVAQMQKDGQAASGAQKPA